ncbi:MAG: protein kinase, partial [Polyangiales bacterium]
MTTRDDDAIAGTQASAQPLPTTRPGFDALWATMSVRDHELSTRETIRPSTLASARSTAPPDIGSLPNLAIEGSCEGPAEYGIGAVLGEGGMGTVLTAMQLPIQREVAIKRLRVGGDIPELAMSLLQEARITGALEHPNIVPVHALGRDERGAPMMVMKRVEGTPWSALLHGGGALPPTSGDRDPLVFHLRVL